MIVENPIDIEQMIESEIKSNQKDFDFDIHEYTLEFLQIQFNPPKDSGKEPDLFIPDYQRNFVWSTTQQSLFIESLLLGLPIPYIFGADVSTDEQDDGRVEIVDGAQRIQTIDAFITNQLVLENLPILTLLNGKKFKDLPLARQRRFLRTSIRMIELSNITEEARRMLFERLNTGGTKLTDMERRRGTIIDSPIMKLIDQLAKEEWVITLLPLNEKLVKEREREEYILRFFAYLINYQDFGHNVQEFIETSRQLLDSAFNEQQLIEILKNTFEFVQKHFPTGFRKSEKSKVVTRVRTEAIAVGVALAIQQKPELLTTNKTINTSWAYEDEFVSMIRSDASNSRPKVVTRIEYVRDKILEQI